MDESEIVNLEKIKNKIKSLLRERNEADIFWFIVDNLQNIMSTLHISDKGEIYEYRNFKLKFDKINKEIINDIWTLLSYVLENKLADKDEDYKLYIMNILMNNSIDWRPTKAYFLLMKKNEGDSSSKNEQEYDEIYNQEHYLTEINFSLIELLFVLSEYEKIKQLVSLIDKKKYYYYFAEHNNASVVAIYYSYVYTDEIKQGKKLLLVILEHFVYAAVTKKEMERSDDFDTLEEEIIDDVIDVFDDLYFGGGNLISPDKLIIDDHKNLIDHRDLIKKESSINIIQNERTILNNIIREHTDTINSLKSSTFDYRPLSNIYSLKVNNIYSFDDWMQNIFHLFDDLDLTDFAKKKKIELIDEQNNKKRSLRLFKECFPKEEHIYTFMQDVKNKSAVLIRHQNQKKEHLKAIEDLKKISSKLDYDVILIHYLKKLEKFMKFYEEELKRL